MSRRGILLVLSSPSGAGKTTISRSLLADGLLELSISVTTRERRPSEANGVHYHFISEQEFANYCDHGALIEWAKVHDNYYGTLKKTVDDALSQGRDVLFDIDYQGAQQLSEKMRDDVVSIFILPPSMKELKARLTRRAEDSAQVIASRLANAREEIAHWQEYDYVLVNDDLEQTLANIRAIYSAETLKRHRDANLGDFVQSLINSRIK